MSAKTIVIFKSSQGDADLAEAVTQAGFDLLEEPILSVEYLEPTLPDIKPETPLVFTSMNGVKAYAALTPRRTNPVYAVGPNTENEAQATGFLKVINAGGDAHHLIDFLINKASEGQNPPLYVRAEDVSTDLRADLAKKSIFLQELIVYRTVSAQKLSIPLLKKLDNREIAAMMFFSKRGAHTFGELVEQYGRWTRLKGIKALCISGGVVQSVSVLPFEEAVAAQSPDRYGMMELLEKLSISLRK